MKRVIVRNKDEFLTWVNAFNGKMNCYTTVYDFEHYATDSKVESSCIKDRMFLDFDAHNEPLESAWVDFKLVVDILKEGDISNKMYFSGKGFHIIVMGGRADDIRSIQSSFTELAKVCPTLDNTGVQTNRLRRIPNTVNLSSKGPYYCIPLTTDDIEQGLNFVLDKAMIGNHPTVTYGTKPMLWNRVKSMKLSNIEVVAPKPPGELPILPCLYNSIMVENPGHYARVYLVQWYRDILSIGEREITPAKQEIIISIIMDEIKSIVAHEDVWLDWDEKVTLKNVRWMVSKGYHAPSCDTILVPQGYCVGKCWRYPE
tara:strand:- start:1100 stop:2041 length:942 start_codon:yes stop_codon:yes gene_type:complete